MSKHLQIVLEEQELADIEAAARRQEMTLSEWVRQALRLARQQEPGVPAPKKLAVIRAAVQHDFPTADVEQMPVKLGGLWQGYQFSEQEIDEVRDEAWAGLRREPE